MMNVNSPEYEILPFFEMTPDLVCIAGKDGFFKKVNHAVIEKLGFTREELLAVPIWTFIYPEDRAETARTRALLINGEPLVNFQNRYITKEGNIIWLHWTSIYFPDKEIVFAIAKDVTKSKEIEVEIEEKYKKFKSLATHFKKRIEKDKKYLATELHEELAQLASVVKMDLTWIKGNIVELTDKSKDRINHALSVSELLITTIRRISFSVSPHILTDLGLDETLKWLSKEFALLNGIPCNLKSNFDESRISHEVKLDLFRICQESLSNIMYHAEANAVNINIKDVGKKINLSITDDGKGFNVAEHQHTSGLTTMRELTASINGQFSLKSKPGKGTQVTITLPKEPEK